MRRVVLVGGGGFAKEVAEIAELTGFTICGYVADVKNEASLWPYLGGLDSLAFLKGNYEFAAVSVGSVNRDGLLSRRRIIENLIGMDIPIISLVSPYAVVSKGVSLGVGVIVAHAAVLSVDSQVGDFCIINTAAVVGHDSIVGGNSVLAPRSLVAGSVRVGENCLLAPGSVVLEKKRLGDNVVVGTGAVVHRDVPSGATIFPVISKVLKQG